MLRKFYGTGLRWTWVAVLVLVIDRLSKLWVLNHLNYYEPVPIMPCFNLTLTFNTGAAFSFLNNASGWQNIFLGGLAVIVCGLIITWLLKIPSKERWLNIALCLVLGGALANALDRALYGYVIDFLSFYIGTWHFAIFNLADSAISVGAFMICVHWLFMVKKS